MLFPRVRTVVFFLLLSCALHAQDPVVLTDTGKITVLGRYMALFEDTSGKSGINDVCCGETAGRFVRAKTDIPNFNVTRSKIWSRIRLVNRSSHERWYLECDNPNVNTVEVYVPKTTAAPNWNVMRSGCRKKQEKRLVLLPASLASCFLISMCLYS